MKANTLSFYEAIVTDAAAHIVEHLDDALDLATLARQAALSPLHFHRIFRGMLGETTIELQRRLRLERAAVALSTGSEPITRIAFQAGYETHEAFTRAFRLIFAVPPTEFRQLSKAELEGCARPPQVEVAAANGIHFTATMVPRLLSEGSTNMEVVIKELEPMRVATVTHVGPYSRISEAFGRLGAIAGPSGLYQDPLAAMIAVYHDDTDSVPADELRSDAGLVVSNGRTLPRGLGELHIAGGRYACAIHRGAYSQLGDTWAQLMGHWLPGSGQRAKDGAAFEIYRNTPENTPVSELITELYMPITDEP